MAHGPQGRGHYERGLFTGGISRESLENGWILLCFPQSRGSLESLEMGFSEKTPFPKDPFFFRTREVLSRPALPTTATWQKAMFCAEGKIEGRNKAENRIRP